eukprot:scpid75050/ scgid25649/ 
MPSPLQCRHSLLPPGSRDLVPIDASSAHASALYKTAVLLYVDSSLARYASIPPSLFRSHIRISKSPAKIGNSLTGRIHHSDGSCEQRLAGSRAMYHKIALQLPLA